MRSRDENAPRYAVALIVGAALLLRFWRLDAAGISHWDAGSYTAGALGIGPYADGKLVLFQTPPLVPALFAALFRLFGPSDTVAMGAVALLGAATVAGLYFAGRRWVGSEAAAVGAAALAGMEYHLLFSRQALTDVPFAFFLLLAVWAFTAAVERGSLLLAVFAGLAAGATILTKYHGFLALVLLGSWLALRRRPAESAAPAPWRLWLVACAVAAVPAIWLLFEIERKLGLAAFRESRREWLSAPGLYLIPWTAGHVARSLLEWVSPVVLGAALVGSVAMLRRRGPGDLLLGLWTALFLAMLPFYRYYPRLLLPVLLPLALAAGVGLVELARRLAPRWERGRVLALSLLPLAAGAWSSRHTLAVEDRGYARAAEFLTLDDEDPDPDILVTQHALLFYLRDSTHPFVCYDDPRALEALESGRFRYLVGDMRLMHAPAFRGFLDRRAQDLRLAAEIENPLPSSTIVNTADFEGLAALRSAATPAQDRKTLETIRIWVLARKTPR